jgi:hypothetical protein
MKPFLAFRAPEHVHWRFIPRGKKYFRVNIWVKRPFQKHQEVNDFRIKEPITIEQLKPILELHANELMDIAQCDLYEHWARFLWSIDDSTTDEEIDAFYDNFPALDYGYECFIWR